VYFAVSLHKIHGPSSTDSTKSTPTATKQQNISENKNKLTLFSLCWKKHRVGVDFAESVEE